MEVKAIAKNIGMSPKKVRLIVDLIRGKSVQNALDQLAYVKKHAVLPVKKVLESAIANAENNFKLSKESLYVKIVHVGEGFVMKRWMPRAFGRATPLRKRSSHITIILDSKESVMKSVKDKSISLNEDQKKKTKSVKKSA